MSSEQLADGVNPLDAELAATWDVLKGYSGRDTDLGIARRFGGAAAAYSLRNIGSDGLPVVKVRRDVDGQGSDPEEDFSANQVQDGTLERWVNGELESTLPADVDTAAAAYSLRKVKGSYGIPVTEVNGTDGFPATLLQSEQSITGTSFTVRHFSNQSPDSSEATAANGVYRVSATKTSAAVFAKAIRIKGLEDGKQYTVKGEFRMVEDTTSGGDSIAQVDISDNTAGTDEDAISTTSTTFVPFFIDAGYNSGGSDNFIDFTVSAVGSETGTITAEFRNVQIIENNNSAVRIRRTSDDEEVVVGFDSDNKISASSPVTATPSGSTTATDLNGFLNETLTVGVAVAGGSSSSNRPDSFTNATNSSFTATVTATAGGYFPYKTATGDVITVSFDLELSEGASPSACTSTSINTVNNASPSILYTSSGSYTNSFTCTADATHFRFADGDDGTFAVTNFRIVSHTHSATVHTWYDQAGSNNAVQETAANQPKIAENGALLADGIDFDGSDDLLGLTSALGATTTQSIFVVQKNDVTTGGTLLFDNRDANDDGSAIFATDTAGNKQSSWDAADAEHTATTNEELISLIKTTSAIKIIANAVEKGSTASTSTIDISNAPKIGASFASGNHYDGSIKELICYNSDQSDNRFKIESNINNYYGLYNDANELSGVFTTDNNGTFSGTPTKDGFTVQTNANSAVRANLKNPIPSLSSNPFTFHISFNANLNDPMSSGGNASPIVRLKNASNTQSNSSATITNGFNSFSRSVNQNQGSDATVLEFFDNDANTSYSISDIRISLIARNGFVETWYDQSGNGNDATQVSAGNQPAIVQNGGRNLDGVEFDGSDDSLNITNSLPITGANARSVFAVVNKDVSSSGDNIMGIGDDTNNVNSQLWNLATTYGLYYNGGNTVFGAGSLSTEQLITAIYPSTATDSGDTVFFIDGSSSSITSSTDTTLATDNTVSRIGKGGGSLSGVYDGSIQELIVFDSDKLSDRTDIEQDIKNFYNI